jgi:hypothetical protein
MLNLHLYIEGQQVELFKDESVVLNQSIQDVRDIQKIFMEYTRSFSVPASKNNNKIFKHYYNYHIDGYNAKIKKAAELHLNYKPFKKGRVKLESVSLKNNKPHTYKLTFFGDTIQLPDRLGEDKLSVLTELSALDFRYNDTNIKTYMADGSDVQLGADEISDAIIFPLITHTNRLIYDVLKNEENNLYGIGSNNGVAVTQLKPAIKLEAIVKAIEMHYDLEFSTDFFNETNTAYSKLYMWLHTKAGQLFEDQEKIQQFKSYSLDGKKHDELLTRTNNFRLNNSKNHIEFDLELKVEPSDSSAEYNIVLYRNGEEFKRFNNLTGDTKNGGALTDSVDLINVKNGDFSVFLETDSAATFDLSVLIQRINKTPLIGGRKDNTLSATLETFTDTNIAVTTQLPDMKVMDFLTSLFKMFNLTAYINDSGTVVVQTLDDYFASSDKTYDITKYVSVSDSQVDNPIPYRQVNMQYEGTDTFLAKNFSDINNRKWGALEYAEDQFVTADDKKAKYEGETYEIELPFEHMLYEKLSDSNFQWGWSVNENKEPYVGKPLLFYAIKPLIGTISIRTLSNSHDTVATPYMPSNSESTFNLYVFGNMSQSLNFSTEFDEYSGVTNEESLFKTYYENYIKDLFDERKRITNLKATLPMYITQNLSLADKFKIFDKIYRINDISTNFETNVSDLTLTNILDTASVQAPLKVFGVEIDLSDLQITADSFQVTADQDSSGSSGFDIPQVTDPIPSSTPQNEPTESATADNLEPCKTTVPRAVPVDGIGEATKVTLKHEITHYGQVCNVDNIDEYGFLVSDSEDVILASGVAADDLLEHLQTHSSVTVFNTVRATGNPTLQTGIKSVTIDSLTHLATKYFRFYVKANNNSNYPEANYISAALEVSTVDNVDNVQKGFKAMVAGHGSYSGYNSIPTLGVMQSQSGLSCDDTSIAVTMFHNGKGYSPEVGDKVKRYEDKDYSGGSNSNAASFGNRTYFGLAIDNTAEAQADLPPPDSTYVLATVKEYVVVEWSTAEVVAKYSCPTITKGTQLVLKTATTYQGHTQQTIQEPSFCDTEVRAAASAYKAELEHNGSGINPAVGDKVRVATIVGGNFDGASSSFPSLWRQGKRSYKLFLILRIYAPAVSQNMNKYIGTLLVEYDTATVKAVSYCYT